MSEKIYNLLELLEDFKEKEEKQTMTLQEAVRDEGKDLESKLNNVLSEFLSKTEKLERGNAQKAFIQRQARDLYEQRIKTLEEESKKIENLLAKKYQSFEDIRKAIKVREQDGLLMSSSLAEQLNMLLKEDNIKKVSVIENFSLKLIERMKNLKVFEEVSQKHWATFEFLIQSESLQIGGLDGIKFDFSHVYLFKCRAIEEELFAVFANRDYYEKLNKEEKACFTGLSLYNPRDFLEDISKMLAILIDDLKISCSVGLREITIIFREKNRVKK